MSEEADDATLYPSFKPQTEFYLPPSLLTTRVNWDIFLSFKAEDTCQTFVAPLCDALKSKELRPFMNDEGMEKGEAIQPNLDEVMQDSALAVVIISPNYADSHGCLKELSSIYKLYNKDSKKWEKRVIPVFYKVDPSDVRKQRGVFGDGLKKLLDDFPKSFSEEEINKWRSALEAIGNISGYTCPIQGDDHAEIIRRIAQQVWSELKNTPVYVAKLDVGLDFRVDKVVDKLNLGQRDVRFLNIHGTPGIGKTTLAKAVYNKLVVKFENRCFISNIREKLTHGGGISTVQNDIIKGLSSRYVEFVDDGKETIKRIVNEKRVLLVLDDVFEAKQLDNLGIVRRWFDEGSRIIITSRNVDVLPKLALSNEHEYYEAEKLDASESLELFSIHAFGRREPMPEFQHISKKVVSLTGGLPLALEIFGSSLVKKTKKEWDDALTKLECMDWPQNLHQILKISYDGLEDQEKVVFLDISCLLLQIDLKKEETVDVLESCGLKAELAIADLVMKSLLKITERNTLWMHDQIRDMGRKIVIEENSEDLGKRSRLWDSMNTMRILRQGKVTEAVRGIVLNIKKPPDFTDEMLCWFNFRRHPGVKSFSRYVIEKSKKLASWQKPNEGDTFILHTNWFVKMKHMKLLQMDNAKLYGDYQYMPSELRWLQWKGCPEKTLPAHIPQELRVLDLSGSKIEQLWIPDRSWWSFNKVVGNLVVLNLSYCAKLISLPDMSGHKHLKKLNLERCVGLTKIHDSIGNLASLVHLNLRGCINLVEFPRGVTGLQALKDLILSDCSKFGELPQEIRSMTSLNRLFLKKPLDLKDETICRLHLQMTPSMSNFNKYLAVKFKSLTSGQKPDDEDDGFTLQTKWFEMMKHMKLLRMDYANLQGAFEFIPSELRWLQWKGCPLKSLPTNLPKELRVLDVSNSNIEQLWSSYCSLWGLGKVVGKLEVLNLSYCPKLTTLPDMSGQKHLKKLNLERCVGLSKIHDSIGNMNSLVHLNLQGCTSLTELPRDGTGLIGLKELILSYCSNLCQLPKDFGRMKSLKRLFLDGTSIGELPETICKLTQLEVLCLDTCQQLKLLPDCLGSLTSLKELSLVGTMLEELPSSIGCLTCLEILDLVHCSSLTVLPESLGKLKALTKLLLNSTPIKKLPSTICSLSNLRVLSLGRCRSLLQLPILKGLVSIVELNLGHTPIEVLPDEICFLEKLEKLEMNYCSKLEKLPESMGKLLNLTVLFVEGAAITQLPESIGEMNNLSWLKLNKCRNLKSLPNSIGKLSSLRILMMENTGITSLPETFKELSGLRVLRMKTSINYLPSDESDDLPKFKLPTDFRKLTNLKELDAQACRISGEIDDTFAKLSELEQLDFGYNSFHKLPSSLEGLFILKKLVLRHCNELKILPRLPSTLEELNAADCYALETICDLSNLERLQELQLANCSKIKDVPGLQCFKSLRRLFMGGCIASAAAVRSRLSKHALENLNTLSLPGNEIPSWFSQTTVNFVPHRNLAIKSVMVAVVVSVDKQQIGPARASLPSIVDIQATIIRQERSVFSTALILMGIPCTTADQLYMCRYKDYHPLVSMLKEGDIIQVGMKKCEADDITQAGLISEAFRGVELKRWGIHLVFENDDDYDIDEVSLSLPESEQSVSQRLAMFFNSMDQT